MPPLGYRREEEHVAAVKHPEGWLQRKGQRGAQLEGGGIQQASQSVVLPGRQGVRWEKEGGGVSVTAWEVGGGRWRATLVTTSGAAREPW